MWFLVNLLVVGPEDGRGLLSGQGPPREGRAPWATPTLD